MQILIVIIFLVFVFIIAINEGEKERLRGIQQEEMLRSDMSQRGINADIEYCYKDILGVARVRYIIDKSKRIILISKGGSISQISFSEVIGCEILVDSQVVGGIGRAVVGGILAGGAGAIVGATTAKKHIMSYSVVIYREDIHSPKEEIVLISSKTSTKNRDYLNAVEFASNVSASIKAIMSTVRR